MVLLVGVATSIIFVATNTCLLQQKFCLDEHMFVATNICWDKHLSHQFFFPHDKHKKIRNETFVTTSILLLRQKMCFVATATCLILAVAPANDTWHTCLQFQQMQSFNTLLSISMVKTHTWKDKKNTYSNRIAQNCKFSWQHPFSSDKHKNKWLFDKKTMRRTTKLVMGTKYTPRQIPPPQKKQQQHHNNPTTISKETRHMSHGQTMDEKTLYVKKVCPCQTSMNTQRTHQNIST